MKIINYIILLFVFLMSFNSEAKSPPPGSGAADVPANILILLDTSGSMDEELPSGDSRYPMDLTFDTDGNVYVAKYYDYVEKYDSAGEFVTSWGGHSGSGTNGKFDFIYAIAADSSDNIYVSDHENNRIQKFNSDGVYQSKIALASGPAYGVAVDNSGNVYAVNGSGRIEKFDSSGTKVGSTWSSTYDEIRHVAFDSTTNSIFAARYDDKKITKFDLDGNYVSQFSLSWKPMGIEVDNDGNLYISRPDSNNRVYKYTPDGTLLDSWGGTGSGLTNFKSPRGIDVRSSDNVAYVADYSNHRIKRADGTAFLIDDGNAKTRIEAAQSVIKKIVSDSNLTSGANFGLMKWNTNATMLVDVSDTGAQEIYNIIDSLSASGYTYLDNAMSLAQDYMLGDDSPMNENAPCQQNILIVISDGYWVDDSASDTAEYLYDNYGIKTFVIGFTTTGNDNYVTLSQKGGSYPDSPLYAENESNLLDVLAAYIRQIISTQLTFTVPTIIPGITNSDHILQSTFMFKKDHQWKGRLLKYALNGDGSIGSLIWDAGEELNDVPADSRSIWTVVNGLTHSLNNFSTANANRLRGDLEENTSSAMEDEELNKLIDFIRGKDSYTEFPTGEDDDGDTLISGERWKLADIYHSKAVAVGKPSTYFSDEADTDSESYYRYVNNYAGFKSGNTCGGACNARDETIYVGSNSGMLHAFDSTDGSEKWAFVPPGLLPSLRDVISTQANETISIYGVDGSPAVKDIYDDGYWKTILLGGLRQGGSSYYALDITDPDNPGHLFSFAYNKVTNKISYWDKDSIRTDYTVGVDTIPDEYDYSKLGESWSDPLILNIKIGSTRKWVGVFGGGYNNNINPNYGSVVYIIDLEDGGKVLQRIDLGDSNSGNSIVNSLPPRLTAITADTTTSFPYAGAYVYFTDLEGSLWKINLSSNGTLYDSQRVFDSESTYDNDRMCYHQLTPSILDDGRFIGFFGTADMARIGRVSDNIANRAYGIIDSNYPNYVSATTFNKSDLQNVTSTGSSCPSETQKGWYIDLDANEKITSSATLRSGGVIFSRYIPDTLNLCSAGSSKISEHDFACGSMNRITSLGQGMATEAVVYKNKMYIGISSDAELTSALPDGFVKEGNLIIGTPAVDPDTVVKQEFWKEEY